MVLGMQALFLPTDKLPLFTTPRYCCKISNGQGIFVILLNGIERLNN